MYVLYNIKFIENMCIQIVITPSTQDRSSLFENEPMGVVSKHLDIF